MRKLSKSLFQSPLLGIRYHSTIHQSQQNQLYELDQDQYHRLADQALEGILDVLEESDSIDRIPNSDILYSSGVLTIALGREKGTWVLNKQPPNRQIWTSSPIAGPRRYEFAPASGIWECVRTRTDLRRDLEQELQSVLGDSSLKFEE